MILKSFSLAEIVKNFSLDIQNFIFCSSFEYEIFMGCGGSFSA